MKSKIYFALALALTCGFAFGDTAFERRDAAMADVAMWAEMIKNLDKNGARAFISPIEFIDILYVYEFPGQSEESYRLTTEDKMLALYKKILEKQKVRAEMRVRQQESVIARGLAREINDPHKAPVVPFRVQKPIPKLGEKYTQESKKSSFPKLPSQLRKAEERKKQLEARKAKREKKVSESAK